MRGLALLYSTLGGDSGWFRGPEGESCDAVCSTHSASCRVERMSAVTSEARMRAVSSIMVAKRGAEAGLDCSMGISVGSDARCPLVANGGGRCYCRTVGTHADCALANPAFSRLCCCASDGVSAAKACPLTQCAAGRHVSGDACVACARGLHSPPDWDAPCVEPGALGACPRGFYCNGGIVAGRYPMGRTSRGHIAGACPGGTYGAREGLVAASECTPISAVCPEPGYFRIGMGATVDCPPCPAGAFCPTPTQATPCPAGRYAPAPGLRTAAEDCATTANPAAGAGESSLRAATAAAHRRGGGSAAATLAAQADRAAAMAAVRAKREATFRKRAAAQLARSEREATAAAGAKEEARAQEAVRERRRLASAEEEAERERILAQREADWNALVVKRRKQEAAAAAAEEGRERAVAGISASAADAAEAAPSAIDIAVDDLWSELWSIDNVDDANVVPTPAAQVIAPGLVILQGDDPDDDDVAAAAAAKQTAKDEAALAKAAAAEASVAAAVAVEAAAAAEEAEEAAATASARAPATAQSLAEGAAMKALAEADAAEAAAEAAADDAAAASAAAAEAEATEAALAAAAADDAAAAEAQRAETQRLAAEDSAARKRAEEAAEETSSGAACAKEVALVHAAAKEVLDIAVAEQRALQAAADAAASEALENMRRDHAASERAARLGYIAREEESRRTAAADAAGCVEALGNATTNVAEQHASDVAARLKVNDVEWQTKLAIVVANTTRDLISERAISTATAEEVEARHIATVDELLASHAAALAAANATARDQHAALSASMSAVEQNATGAATALAALRKRLVSLTAEAAAARTKQAKTNANDRTVAMKRSADEARRVLQLELEGLHAARIEELTAAHAAATASMATETAQAHALLVGQTETSIAETKRAVQAECGENEAAAVTALRANHERASAAAETLRATELARVIGEHASQLELVRESARGEREALKAQHALDAAVAAQEQLADHHDREKAKRQADATAHAKGMDELRSMHVRRLEEAQGECDVLVAKAVADCVKKTTALADAAAAASTEAERRCTERQSTLSDAATAECDAQTTVQLSAAAVVAEEALAAQLGEAAAQQKAAVAATTAQAVDARAKLESELNDAHRLAIVELESKHRASVTTASLETTAARATLDSKRSEREEELRQAAAKARAALVAEHAKALKACRSSAAEGKERAMENLDSKHGRELKLAAAECEQRVEAANEAAALASEAALSQLKAELDTAKKRDVEDELLSMVAERDELKGSLARATAQRDALRNLHDDAHREASDLKRDHATAQGAHSGCAKQLADLKTGCSELQGAHSTLQAQQRGLEEDRTAAILAQKRLKLKLKKAQQSGGGAALAGERALALSREQARVVRLIAEVRVEVARVTSECGGPSPAPCVTSPTQSCDNLAEIEVEGLVL